MEHASDLFSLIIFIYFGIGIVGYHTLNKLQEILDKL